MKLVVYALWGADKKYTVGAIKNATINLEIYPDFISRFYVDALVPKTVLYELEEIKNTEVIYKNVIGDWRFSLNRFLPFADPTIEYFLSRDCDSRCTPRERAAVNEWILSNKTFHIMRDHPFHGGFPILAGLFGSKGGIISSVKKMIDSSSLPDSYHSDQVFLQEYIFPLIRNSVLEHDEIFTKKPFPTLRNGLEFVGEVFDENEQNTLQHRHRLQTYLEKNG